MMQSSSWARKPIHRTWTARSEQRIQPAQPLETRDVAVAAAEHQAVLEGERRQVRVGYPKGPRMAKSIAQAANASRLSSFLLVG